ncbi:plasmid replication protein RepC [Microvirga tunisiensis]|uniref:Replication initiation protein RepC n=1 Tax=Microvirga tunisiensis TaxID=2108360 RepID=A0A5N7MGY7_9HYPH|nr:plasmid replication protein RepC [Microvirga tunisiensis]MPR06189.1 replication initiation protein RepC [Microvirga tunisiensis]MPR26068.1 replication initiation protein RepC [Microvirga tunisiensis]
MDHISSTPFGRPLSLAMVAARVRVGSCPQDTIAEKWKVLDNLREAKEALGVSDRALSVLNALLTFHQDTTLALNADLVVYPSNRALLLRANGMAPATLRRNLAALVQAGLVVRRDSPNGKRYARKGEGGQIEQAFGFDLGPLVARAAEFEKLAREARAAAKARYLLREEISLLRRDISQTILVGLEEGLPGPWLSLSDRFKSLGAMPARNADVLLLEGVAKDLRALWRDVDKCLTDHLEKENLSTNESHSEQHHQNSNTYPSNDSESGCRVEEEETVTSDPEAPKQPVRTFPLSLVLKACPDIAMYTRGGEGIRTWRALSEAAALVRPILGISPSAWAEACDAMGHDNAAITLAAILQRAEAIRSPGAYLRNLTQRARANQFSLGPVIMALLRAEAQKERSHG